MINVKGVISPIITAFTEGGEIYEKGIRNMDLLAFICT